MSDPIQQALAAARGLVAQGRPRDAAQLYAVILKHLPDNRDAQAELAALEDAERRADALTARFDAVARLHGEGRHHEALEIAEAIAADDPTSALAANMIGVLLLSLGEREKAVAAFRRTLALKPDFAEAEANLGTLLTEMGRPGEALPHLEAAAAARPDAPGILTGLANSRSALGDRGAAVALYRRAIAADPSFPHAHSNLGALLTAMGDHAGAEAAFRQALALKPDFADAWLNFGNLLKAMDLLDEAEAALRKALSINPQLMAARNALALLLADAGRAEEAADECRRASETDPSNLDLLARALYADAMICHWDETWQRGLRRLAATDFSSTPEKAPSPFVLLTLIDDPQAQKRAAAALVARERSTLAAPAVWSPRIGQGRIRVGYFSADFHGHATMYLMARLFDLHDRDAFEIHAFSFGPTGDDPMRDRLVGQVEHFHEVGAMGPEEIADLSRSLGIDIAVDLKGFTRDSRARTFLSRAAPIQVNYLGHPGTCGADDWDYIIADRAIVPEGSEADYAETIVVMPGSYQVNDDRRAISPRHFTRAECGLPDHGFVFCCFNNSYKITPREFAIWMRLLTAVEGSVLWLLATSQAAERNLKAEAARRGVDPARLVFAPRMPVPDHLARHALADLFLDTFAVNAHTTASDALWAGVPVLTRPGHSFVARVGASLVQAAGLPELVVATDEEYERTALTLAGDAGRLAALRARLSAAPASLPLFDTPCYTRHLEDAYRQMMDNLEAGNGPRPIHL